MRAASPAVLLLLLAGDAVASALSIGSSSRVERGCVNAVASPIAWRAVCPPRLQQPPEAEASPPPPDAASPPEEGAASEWYEDPTPTASASVPAVAPPPPPLAEQEDPGTALSLTDMVNTRWDVKATPRADSWLPGGVRDQEFTLLDDFSVVWGGSAGGFGTGGRWTLKDGLLEVIRTTPLGLVTGRDYYMAQARAGVDDKLRFTLSGIIRSYNALQPVSVIADFEATRRAGRFVRDVEEETNE